MFGVVVNLNCREISCCMISKKRIENLKEKIRVKIYKVGWNKEE